LKYLGRKHGLVPKNEEEHRRIDLIEAEAMDIRNNWVTLCYGSSSKVDFVSFDNYNQADTNIQLIDYLTFTWNLSIPGNQETRVS